MNAVLNYRGNRKELENAKIYVDLFPCNECAKIIIQAGIKRVVFNELYRMHDGINLLKRAGVACVQIDLYDK